MHIAIFLDQHPDTLGGAQLSVMLQAKYLRRLGHVITICAPRNKKYGRKQGIVTFDSLSLGTSNYNITYPSRKVQQKLDVDLSKLPPIDIVHIQADYWGAMLGFAYAQKNKLPTAITFHNNVDVGSRVVLGKLSAPFISLMRVWLHNSVGASLKNNLSDGWQYLAILGDMADVRIAPTSHFMRSLQQHGVKDEIIPVSNGLDDDKIFNISRVTTNREKPRIIWAGRLSHEKRIMEFLKAFKIANLEADIEVYGDGQLEVAAKNYVVKNNLTDKVHFKGAVSTNVMLKAIADADILVQTSIGFETQGRTIIESLALGTPVLVCDPLIVEDFDSEVYWLSTSPNISALANTLHLAFSDITGGRQKKPGKDIAKKYKQSNIAKELQEIYTTKLPSYTR